MKYILNIGLTISYNLPYDYFLKKTLVFIVAINRVSSNLADA